jgi:hypothetical protein
MLILILILILYNNIIEKYCVVLCVAIEAKRQTDERDWNSIVDTDCIYYCNDTGAGTVCVYQSRKRLDYLLIE